VPFPELPPFVPFTCHVTFELLVPDTIAVNCCVAPARRETLLGETVTTTTPGVVDCVPLHAPNMSIVTINVTPAASVAAFELSALSMSTNATTHDVCHREAGGYKSEIDRIADEAPSNS
jgi:hypothetical protein